VKTSENIGDLAAALAKAQGAVEGATKDSANPFFRSKYADLASVWDACRSQLSSNGLSVVQFPRTKYIGDPVPYEWTSKQGEVQYGVRIACVVSVLTRVVHASGQWMEDRVSTMLPNANPQSVGSAITYLRRYALQSVIGIAPEDDDAEAAEDRPAGGQRVNSKDRPVSGKAGLPDCPKCKSNKDVIVSKFGPGFYCLKSKTKFDPVADQAATDPQVEQYAEAFE
jgi:hypothetical protein